MAALEEARVEVSFTITAPITKPIQELREEARRKTGLDVYISIRAGPFKKLKNDKVECPIVAIDDLTLEGYCDIPYEKVPVNGYLYIGHFIARTETSLIPH